MRAGRRTEVEKSEGPKCYGHVDFLTQDEIPIEFAIRIDKRCYDVRSLVTWFKQSNSYKDPLQQSVFFNEEQIKKINKKLIKLGFEPIIKRQGLEIIKDIHEEFRRLLKLESQQHGDEYIITDSFLNSCFSKRLDFKMFKQGSTEEKFEAFTFMYDDLVSIRSVLIVEYIHKQISIFSQITKRGVLLPSSSIVLKTKASENLINFCREIEEYAK
jgi:hypothetical protein